MGNVTNTTDSVRLMSLGGLGEFGMNMMLVECGDDAIIIDAGMMFPDRHMHGVDFVLPDLSAVLARRDKLRGVILTHGHEDHIGGLSSLLQEVDIPAYGTDLTLAFASSRLEEYGLLSKADLREIDADARLDFGCMSCEFFETAHSVPGVLGVALRTPVGTIVHTSDFKLDHTPIGSDRFHAAGHDAPLHAAVTGADATDRIRHVDAPSFASTLAPSCIINHAPSEPLPSAH